MNATPSEARWWHPVCAEGDALDAPLAVRLFDRDLVVWRDAARAPHIFVDQCPHRGARLSLGHVRDGKLQCGYHGWTFDGAGACVQMPSQPDFKPPAACAADVWQAASAHGLVWAARAPADDAPPPLAGLPARRVVCGPYDVATSAPRLVENFLDTSHFAFVHEGFLGDRAHTAVPPYSVERTADGRPLIEHYRAWQPRATATSADGDWVDYRYEVLAPYAALLQKQPGAGAPGDAYALFTSPLDEETTRVWFVQCSDDAVSSDDALRGFQERIFAQDRPVLESQRPRRLPLSGDERHVAADRLCVAYRRWLQNESVRYGVC